MGKAKNHKQPKFGAIPEIKKEPRIGNTSDANAMNPAWRVSLLQWVAPYGCHILDLETSIFIQTKLKEFEAMTWNEILVRDKWKNHTIKVGEIALQARNRLIEIGQDDIDELVSLRLTGTARIWGIRDQNILKLLWWDPDHQVYQSHKKHT